MARRPFDPAAEGLTRPSTARATCSTASAVDELVAGADVRRAPRVHHHGRRARRPRTINLTGSRNVFERRRRRRGSSGWSTRRRSPPTASTPTTRTLLTEDVPPRGTERLYYSAQKAELEGALREVLAGTDIEAYVFRPCIVAGPDAPDARCASCRTDALRSGAAARRCCPIPGSPFQLVHHDDVATALVAAVLGRGEPASTTSRATGR